jgi:hypothetical protein
MMALCLAAFLAAPSFGQVFTGRIDIAVKDSTGAAAPGVTVELSGVQTGQAVTDSRGEARFLNLAPGRYMLVAKLSGFNDYRNDNVPVGAGGVVSLIVTLTVGAVSETVNVVSETPVIEVKKQLISTSVGIDELQNIPSARDPWVVLQTVPGIIVDRVNVGGAESGQQSNFQAKGAAGADNTWNMDGIAITDMAAIGASPTYYDFDMFQEMQVTTGGADPSNPTPGVQLNFVLRSGTNKWRASARYYFENNDLQSDNVGASVFSRLQSYNRVENYKDYGVEGGGPLVMDKLFAWGAYGKTMPNMEIYSFNTTARNVFTTGPGCQGEQRIDRPAAAYVLTARDCTTLENYSAKLTYNLSQNLRGTFTYFRGDKIKSGRGASANRPAATTWNQKGPTDLYKGEVNYTVSNATYLTARYAYTGGGFSLTPIGGLTQQAYLDDAGIWGGSFVFYQTERPQNNVQLEGNHFRGNHEFKFGFGFRKASVMSQSGWPTGAYSVHIGYPDIYTVIVRDWAAAGNTKYLSGFIGDQYTRDRFTFSGGLRWDRHVSSLEAATAPANTLSPLLPSLTAAAKKNLVTYNSVTPRLGVTYALTEDRKTLLRASYAMFASQLDSTRGYIESQIPGYSYVYFYSRDLNGNQITDPNELRTFAGTYGFDPTDPLNGNPDRIGSYSVPKTNEVIVGLERELMRNFGISLNYTNRRYSGFNWTQTNGITSADYTEAGRVVGSTAPIGPYNVPFYAVNAAAVPADHGRIHEERKGYSQRFWGLEIAATKRMSNRWMMRAGWSTSNHTEHFDGPDALGDPTPRPTSPNVDGGNVIIQTGGSGKTAIYMVLPKYQYNMALAYTAKFDINVGMNYLFRQGFAQPFFRSNVAGSGDALSGTKTVLLAPNPAEYRLPNVHSLDFRVNKALTLDKVNINIDVDVFNLFNNATVLGKVFDVRLTTFNQVREIMNPRIVRLGIRLGWN